MHLIDTVLGWTFVGGRLRIRTPAGVIPVGPVMPHTGAVPMETLTLYVYLSLVRSVLQAWK